MATPFTFRITRMPSYQCYDNVSKTRSKGNKAYIESLLYTLKTINEHIYNMV